MLLVLAGLAWIGTLTVLNAALQLTLPQWVRSRGAATYILVFMGTMAIGSFLWGLIAEFFGTTEALTTAAIVLVLVAISTRLIPLLPGTGTIDRTISLTWATPTLVFEPDPTDGPVLVINSYTVRPHAVAPFEDAMKGVAASRRRTGGYRWQLFRSGEDEDVLLETFLVPSWAEFRRQQTQRLTGRDREILAEAREFSEGDPIERHYFSARTSAS